MGPQLADVGNQQIRRPEIVSPLTDTVSFINGDETDLHVAQFYLEDVRPDAFR